jgi:D-alanine-D-alanine ligase-like ATP-grasp enzyme
MNYNKLDQPFVTSIIQKLVAKLDAEIIIEDEYRYAGAIIFKNGKRFFFKGNNIGINLTGASEIAKDKGYSHYFLKKFGYKTPENQTFFSKELNESLKIKRTIDDGYEFAKNLGFPVIVKPNDMSQGDLVTKVYNKKEYYIASRKILSQTNVMLVERFYNWQDYRVVVLNNKIVAAYQRLPLSVIGDGSSTIQELIEMKQKTFDNLNSNVIIETKDFRIKNKLKRQGLTFSSVLAKEREIYLLDNANLSTGGDAKDFTETIHEEYKKLAINITSNMGLRMSGIDIMTSSDITNNIEDYIIIEINSSPGLEHYFSIGNNQKKKVEDFYLEILTMLSSKKIRI